MSRPGAHGWPRAWRVCGAVVASRRFEEVETPVPGEGEILVRIEASGLCHTDIHAAHGDWPVPPKLPFTPGH